MEIHGSLCFLLVVTGGNSSAGKKVPCAGSSRALGACQQPWPYARFLTRASPRSSPSWRRDWRWRLVSTAHLTGMIEPSQGGQGRTSRKGLLPRNHAAVVARAISPSGAASAGVGPAASPAVAARWWAALRLPRSGRSLPPYAQGGALEGGLEAP
jgi:hypothetical protein